MELFHKRAYDPACGIPACTRCDAATRRCLACLELHQSAWVPTNSFRLAPDGTCYSPTDVWADFVGRWIVLVLVVILLGGAFVQFLVVRCGLKQGIQKVSMVYEQMLKEGVTATIEGMDQESLLRPRRPSIKVQQHGEYVCEAEADQVTRSREAIRHGLRSWLQGQMRDWEFRSAPEPKRYGLFADFVWRYIVGPGLPLFYGFQGLVFVSSAAIAVTLLAVSKYSGLGPELAEWVKSAKKSAQEGNPVQLDQRLRLEEYELTKYAEGMFYGLGALYLVLCVLSVIYAVGSREFLRIYHSGNSCMQDYTLALKRLPACERNETRIRQMVEHQLNCADDVVGVSIAYDLSDDDVRGVVDRLNANRVVRAEVEFYQMGSTLAQQGFGYPGFLARDDALDESADQREFEELYHGGKLRGSGQAFVVFKSKSACSAVRQKIQGMWMRHTVHPSDDEAADISRALGCECVGKLLDTWQLGEKEADRAGRKFAQLMSDVVVNQEVLEAGTRVYDASTLRGGGPLVVERLVRVAEDTFEPTGAMWSNFGKPKHQRDERMYLGLWRVLRMWGLIVVLVYVPIFYFLTYPFGVAQTPTSPCTAQLQGILLSISGNFLGMTIWSAVNNIGYFDKNLQDTFFVVSSTATQLVNTLLFGLTGLALFVQRGFGRVNMMDARGNTFETVISEIDLFRSFYGMLIPGWLFSGVLVGNVMGIVLPLLLNFVFTNVVFTLRLLPRYLRSVLTAIIPGNPQQDWLTARGAELAFRGQSLSLAWEFSNYIVTPSVCCLSLFVMSPNSWRVFAYLAVWAAFMFALHRCVTVPLARKEMSGIRVTILADRMWGLPSALVLAAFGFWGVRCGAFGGPDRLTSYWVVLWLFLLGLIGHSWVLDRIAHSGRAAFDLRDVPYEEVRDTLRYTWFNTNPVHVLKSCHLPEELGGDAAATAATALFEYGKEYLQVPEHALSHRALLSVGQQVQVVALGPFLGQLGRLVEFGEEGNPKVALDRGDVKVFGREDLVPAHDASSTDDTESTAGCAGLAGWLDGGAEPR